MKHIVFVLDAFGFFGGPERRAYRIAKGLKKRGNKITIISIMKADESSIKQAEIDGINAISLTEEHNKALKSFRIDVFLKLRKLLKSLKPDTVITFEFLADYTTKMALLGIDTPVITFIGSTVWKWERKWHRRVFMEYFVKKSKSYIANSEKVKKNIIRVLPNAKEKIDVIYNPINIEQFRPLSLTEKAKIREKFNLKDCFIVGSVVRFYNPKGADVLIEAFAKSKIDAKLVLVGDGKLKDKLIQMTEELNIKDRAIFLGAIEATKEIYSLFDVCVIPSQKGGFDNVVIESMACGIPTIATKETGIGEIAISGEHLLITDIDSDSISKAIRELWKNKELREKLTLNGRKFVEENLSLERIVEKIEKSIYG
ncbi:glycosyltransferase family 4 protein [Hippea alviniae]|uniref:glycosyltransferase family 4 protein n=1 Tax=Hippea alviniae TaxID=1279027 RepID=UPI0003B329A5|nr:glycosyltransferase family 4 protein [Hippea alviniae]